MLLPYIHLKDMLYADSKQRGIVIDLIINVQMLSDPRTSGFPVFLGLIVFVNCTASVNIILRRLPQTVTELPHDLQQLFRFVPEIIAHIIRGDFTNSLPSGLFTET